MSYGFAIYGPDGSLRVDGSKPISRIYDAFVVGATATGSKSYPGLSGKRFAVYSYPLNTDVYLGLKHTVTVSGTTVSWQPARKIGDHETRRQTMITVFLY